MGDEGGSSRAIWGKNVLSKEKSTCKGPGVRMCLVYLKKAAGVAGAEWEEKLLTLNYRNGILSVPVLQAT